MVSSFLQLQDKKHQKKYFIEDKPAFLLPILCSSPLLHNQPYTPIM